jgi:uncharacterized membrane protein YhhN
VWPVLLCAAAVAGCLVSERRQSARGLWLAKPLASAGFLWAAWAWGALGSPFGRWLLAGLAFCALGDVLLIPKTSRVSLRAGLLAFGAGHAFFAAAFLAHGVSAWACAGAAALALTSLALVARWLRPHLGREDRWPVRLYGVVIAGMLATAAGAVAAGAPPAAGAGAALFALSDLAVAQDRFVAPSFTSTLWGLPAYYTAQISIAWGAALG